MRLEELEVSLDAAMKENLALLKDCFPQTCTAGVFFQGGGEGWHLRVFISEAASLLANAELGLGQGLLGRLMNQEIAHVLEGDIIANSTRLRYYSQDERIHSLIALPLCTDGIRKGAVFLDSREPGAYGAQALARLGGVAHSMGMLIQHAHSSLENSLNLERLRLFSGYQIKLLEKISREHIVEAALEYMRASLEADQYFVAARLQPGSDQVEVLAAEGMGAETLRGFRFALSEGGLIHLAFKDSDHVVNRSLRGSKPVVRMSPREPYQPFLQSFLAAPVTIENGVEMVVCASAHSGERFSDFTQNLSVSIARSAGFALSRARLYQEKEQLAIHDGLTGACNHRAFQERLREELLRAGRTGGKVALLMMDIDFFKRVNDVFGHAAGDAVLRETVRLLERTVRAGMDLIARYGGEEFTCLLPETDARGAHETAERIRRAVEGHEFKSGSVALRVTLSIGGAVFPDHAREGKGLVEKADKALYAAKESGRNQVVLYH